MPKFRISAIALAAALAATAVAHAQSFPSRQINILVGFPPGGPTDPKGQSN